MAEQIFYCPCCGHEMQAQPHHEEFKGHVWHYTVLTCRFAGCKIWGATTTDSSLADGSFAESWNYTPKYDYLTGEELK